jgi:hypothetical protein
MFSFDSAKRIGLQPEGDAQSRIAVRLESLTYSSKGREEEAARRDSVI